ncbi:hypothetical protein [Desulfonatronum sp. SC1]|uniref:hypothetical protein n=1 Tax=Desulfonatronum sp. SC1 TaxID=2109626 RepID=UPI000D309D22|nr:hypothetical protein [Desulfonatronum sp. SC1]PTN32742.1 hypothetical protein C6366_15955 [Desulfonatronum sp. SC1]
MKINPDQSSLVKADAERDVRRVNRGSERFEDLLLRATENVPSGQSPPSGSAQPLSTGDAMRLTPTQMLFPVDKTPGFESTAMDSLDNLLSRWEKYAHQLAAQPPELRSANGILDEISTEIGALKANWPQQTPPQPMVPELRGVLDELEVMAVTERIKFNRGDYI